MNDDSYHILHLMRPPSHPFDHAMKTKLLLSSAHHTINLVQFMMEPIDLDLPLYFYGGVCRKYFENWFSSSFQQLMLVVLNQS